MGSAEPYKVPGNIWSASSVSNQKCVLETGHVRKDVLLYISKETFLTSPSSLLLLVQWIKLSNSGVDVS